MAKAAVMHCHVVSLSDVQLSIRNTGGHSHGRSALASSLTARSCALQVAAAKQQKLSRDSRLKDAQTSASSEREESRRKDAIIQQLQGEVDGLQRDRCGVP